MRRRRYSVCAVTTTSNTSRTTPPGLAVPNTQNGENRGIKAGQRGCSCRRIGFWGERMKNPKAMAFGVRVVSSSLPWWPRRLRKDTGLASYWDVRVNRKLAGPATWRWMKPKAMIWDMRVFVASLLRKNKPTWKP